MRLRTDDSNSLAVDGFQSTTRGSTVPGHDTEMQLIRSFPEVAHLIEKPISAGSFEEAEKVKEALQGTWCGISEVRRARPVHTTLANSRQAADGAGTAVKEMKWVEAGSITRPQRSPGAYTAAQDYSGRQQPQSHGYDGHLSHGVVS
jgi:hypothetical protein